MIQIMPSRMLVRWQPCQKGLLHCRKSRIIGVVAQCVERLVTKKVVTSRTMKSRMFRNQLMRKSYHSLQKDHRRMKEARKAAAKRVVVQHNSSSRRKKRERKVAVRAGELQPATMLHLKIRPIVIQRPCGRRMMLPRSRSVSSLSRHGRMIRSSS
jgi:hypothetical protein